MNNDVLKSGKAPTFDSYCESLAFPLIEIKTHRLLGQTACFELLQGAELGSGVLSSDTLPCPFTLPPSTFHRRLSLFRCTDCNDCMHFLMHRVKYIIHKMPYIIWPYNVWHTAFHPVHYMVHIYVYHYIAVQCTYCKVFRRTPTLMCFQWMEEWQVLFLLEPSSESSERWPNLVKTHIIFCLRTLTWCRLRS